MQKAKLNISKTKKGGYAVSLTFEDNKTLPLSDHKPTDDKLNGKEVEVIREDGQVKKIICEGQVIYEKTSQGGNMSPINQKKHSGNQPKQKNTQSSTSSSIQTATAPYNFVPLNHIVVPAEEIPDFDTYHNDRYTGYIDLEIETRTPLYIRDILNEDEIKNRDSIEDARKQNKSIPPYCNPDFFSPGNALRIPGSSLRGMTRTMVEIVSFGKFGFFDDKQQFHFRSFADKSLNLREQYSSQMIDKNQGAYYPKVNAGYLEKRGLKYIIRPADKLDGCQFFRVEERDVVSKSLCLPMKEIKEYRCSERGCKETSTTQGICPKHNKHLLPFYNANDTYKTGIKHVKFKYEKLKAHHHSIPLYYSKVKSIWAFDDPSAPTDAIEGYLVLSNWMRGQLGKEGKHLHWVIGPPNQDSELEFADNVIKNYKEDKNRDPKTDLLSKFNEAHNLVPCFYISENNKVISFGHTGFFRRAYKYYLGQLLPVNLKNFNGMDIPEAIFGNEKTFAGRVFFEDAFCLSDKEEALICESVPKILSGPKPTTFQHYLEQDISKIDVDDKKNVRGLKTYNDSDAILRGYKLYWHKDDTDWQQTNQTEIDAHKSQYTKINPVKPGIKFKGKIRFENLSKVELGALLFALDLPVGCCHKIGMGKPLGLGSIAIKPTLFISDRRQRYRSLTAEWGEISNHSDLKYFKQEFEKYVLEKIYDKSESLWNTDRLKELKTMLNFDHKPSNEKTRYMEIEKKIDGKKINEFKNRPVLPHPTQVV